MKKIISMLLICAIIVCTIPINVLASNGNHGGGGGKHTYTVIKDYNHFENAETVLTLIERMVYLVGCQAGAIFDGDFVKASANTDTYNNWLKTGISNGDVSVANEDPAEYQFSEKSITQLKSLINETIKEQQTFVVYKTKSADNIQPASFVSYPQYLSCIKALRDNQFVYFTGGSGYGPNFGGGFETIVPFRDFTFYGKHSNGSNYGFNNMLNGDFNLYNGVKQGKHSYGADAINKDWEDVVAPYQFVMSGSSTEYLANDNYLRYNDFGYSPARIYSYKGDVIPIFKDIPSAKNYLAGYSNIYMGTPRSDSGAMTIPSNVNTADFDKMYSKIAESIRDSGGKMGTSEITTMVDEEIKKMLEKMGEDIGDIEDNTGESVGLLAEIRDILKSIKNWLVANFVVNTADAVVNIIDKLFGKDGDEDVDIGKVVNSAFGDFAVLAKTKFPFSIPWDLMFIIKLLSAPPDAPVFEIPFTVDSLGYSQVIVIDFGMFRTLSNISRTFLTLLWAYVLILSTKSLIRRD